MTLIDSFHAGFYMLMLVTSIMRAVEAGGEELRGAYISVAVMSFFAIAQLVRAVWKEVWK